jgi:predicted extracellular nuclease
MRRNWLVLTLAGIFTAALAPAGHAISPDIVISQIYGGAGCGTAGCSTYRNDYIELFNRSAGAVSVNGWSVQYASATGTSWQVTNLPNVSIPAGGYLLVAEAFNANGVNAIPTPDVTGSISMSATVAKIALLSSTTALSGSCPTGGSIVDFVGYGTTSSCSETANAPAPSTTNAIFRALAGCTDTDNNSTDFSAAAASPRNSATALNVCGGPPAITLNINNVSLAEGDPPGTTTFTFAVTLTAPAGAGGVTFDIATADGTAQDDDPATEDNDYVAQSLTGQSIPMGSTGPYNFNVTVNRDTSTEPNETFFVNVTNVTGANVGDGQGLGTINNDDVSLTPIHDIQGPGNSSPIVGASVTTRGIVTGVRSNGFFIQEPDATVDADPATSEGVLVFGAPPAAAAVGNFVQVTGTVTEFVPSQDPLQPPLTELSSATTVLVSTPPTAPPIPAAIPLTATFPDPAGPVDQLERLEGMRVSVASLTVVGPTLGTVNEPNATATSTGVFFGVVTGVPRPFREAGIQAPDPAPSGGSIPPIPRFDSNPERIRVDSDGLVGGPLVNVGHSAVVTGLIGPLDYSFRTYTILPDPGASIGVTGGPSIVGVSAPLSSELTIGAYNVERFFDTVNDPGIGEPVLTPTAFDNRLNKASLGIRNQMQMPDILGMVEVENLTALQALAARISADAIAASQPDPEYDAYLVEGNDVGGIDVGFLVKTAEVAPGTPRVEVVEVVQELDGTLLVNPDSSTSILNDRPPLRLNAIVHHGNGASYPVTVIVNHLRSLNDAASEDAGTNGWPTLGARVRAKRQQQAEDLANLVQARQVADPNERIVLIGDFNAFEVNDGLGDSMGVIDGTPSPDNETAVPGDGVDLVNPDFDNLFDSVPPADRYSFIFDGNAQNLDHALVSANVTNVRMEHARINADFPATARNDSTSPSRLADHDPLVMYISPTAFGDGMYFTVTPCRAADTRSGSPLQDGVPQDFTLHGVCDIPTTATAVAMNVTAVGATGGGELTLFETGIKPPSFAQHVFDAGNARALFSTPELSSVGQMTITPSVAGGGTVHVLIDVMGYYQTAAPPAP